MLIKTLCHRVLIFQNFHSYNKIFSRMHYSKKKKKIECLRKCSVTSKLAISEYLIKIRNGHHPSAEDIFWDLSESPSKYHMKVLKTIYIKSRQPFLCKQKKWLLGHNMFRDKPVAICCWYVCIFFPHVFLCSQCAQYSNFFSWVLTSDER